MDFRKLAAVYLLCINLIAFAAYGWDKRKARKGAWRIPERTLFLLAVLGGSVGAIAGVYLFHHKTRHKKFTLGLPVVLLLQIFCAVIFFCKIRG